MIDESAIESAILRMIAERGPEKTLDPSEAARAVAGTSVDAWGPLMQPLKRIASRLAREGRIVLYRKGRPVAPEELRGIYRIGLPREE